MLALIKQLLVILGKYFVDQDKLCPRSEILTLDNSTKVAKFHAVSISRRSGTNVELRKIGLGLNLGLG